MDVDLDAESGIAAGTGTECEQRSAAGPVLPLREESDAGRTEPAGARWTDHGHMSADGAESRWTDHGHMTADIRNKVPGAGSLPGVEIVEIVRAQSFCCSYPGAWPHSNKLFLYGAIRSRECALNLASEWLHQQHARQPRIQDLYLVQREACLLETELFGLAKHQWHEFRQGLEAQWKQEDDRLLVSADLGDLSDPIATGWIERETHAAASAKADQRQRVLSEKWDELQQRASKAYEEWKSAADMRAWGGKRLRQPGEDRVLQERLEFLRSCGGGSDLVVTAQAVTRGP